MKLVWSPRSLADREEILAYIAKDDPEAAFRWDDRIVERAERAARVPRTGHRPRELRDAPEFASVLQVWLRAYRIIYEVGPGTVVVLRVWQGQRPFGRDRLR